MCVCVFSIRAQPTARYAKVYRIELDEYNAPLTLSVGVWFHTDFGFGLPFCCIFSRSSERFIFEISYFNQISL